jgi:hypothetical protein
MAGLTDDIKSPWLNVLRRLQSALSGQQGYAIVSIDVVVDESNAPVFWSEPRVVKLEPKAGGARFLAQVISGLRM